MFDRENQDELAVLQKMHDFNNQGPGGISWTAGIRQDGKLSLVSMPNRPCYGEMRAYGKDSTRPEDSKPGDLTRPLKAGLQRDLLGVRFQYTPVGPNDLYGYGVTPEDFNQFILFCFSSDSPWRTGFNIEGIEFSTKEGCDFINGVVLTDTDVDPTAMVSLFMYIRAQQSQISQILYTKKEFGLTMTEAVLAHLYFPVTFVNKKPNGWKAYFSGGYFLPHRLDLSKFLSGKTLDLSKGRTWRQAEDYNRPQLQDLFKVGKKEDVVPFTNRILTKAGYAPTTGWQPRELTEYPKMIEALRGEMKAA